MLDTVEMLETDEMLKLFRGGEINVWPAGVVPVNLIFGSSSRSRKTTRKQQQTTLFLCLSNSTTGVLP